MQFGQGTALLGGADALNSAVQRRQMGQGGATDQVTPSSASFNPQTAMAPTQTGGQPMPGGAAPAPVSQNTSPSVPEQSSESQLIIKTLASRLSSLSKAGL